MTRTVLLCLVLVGCFDSAKVSCDDGRICPPGYTCDDARSRCVSPEQQAACVALTEGDACTFSGAPGACRGGVCEPLLCGDGIVAGNELCDGDDLAGATCQTAGFYDAAGLACSPFCTFDTSACTGFCGDGVVNGPEQCDGVAPAGSCVGEGFDAGPLACSASCGESFASCARFGWRPEPLDGLTANAIGGTGVADEWVVGGLGRIAHFDGSAWLEQLSPTTMDLYAVASASPTDAWAVGVGHTVGAPGVLLHYTGTWKIATAPDAQYSAVAAIDPTHVYFTTADHDLIWWNGTAMQTLVGPGGGLTTIAGTSPTDLWVTTSGNQLWHYDGTWKPALLGQLTYSITAITPANVWVAGATASFQPVVSHWDGTAWTSYTDLENRNVFAVAASAFTRDVWASTSSGDLLHFDGKGWVQVATTSKVGLAVRAFGPGQVVGVSPNGLAYRFRGQAWGGNVADASTDSVGVWSDSASDIFVAAIGEIDRYDGSVFRRQLLAPTNEHFISISGTTGSDVWSASDQSIYHYDGAAWSAISDPPPGKFYGVWSASANDVWVIAQDGVYRGPGVWTRSLATLGSFVHLSGTGPDDVWAVTKTGLSHWDGATWTAQPIPAVDLLAVSARTPTDVWVTAANAHALHWNGATWTDALVPTVADLRWIAALASDEVVAASPLEMIYFDGRAWTPIELGVDTSMDPIAQLFVPARDRFEVLYSKKLSNLVRELIRTRPWACRAVETDCGDAIDDDCDGLTDELDPDCH